MGRQSTQIRGDRKIINTNWRWVKKQTSRFRRRQEKRDVENVPPRSTEGWTA